MAKQYDSIFNSYDSIIDFINNKKSIGQLDFEKITEGITEIERKKQEYKNFGFFHTPFDYTNILHNKLKENLSDGDILFDPACGHGMLFRGLQNIGKNIKVRGIELTDPLSNIARTFLEKEFGERNAYIMKGDTLNYNWEDVDGYNIIISNPPFGQKVGYIEKKIVEKIIQALKTQRLKQGLIILPSNFFESRMTQKVGQKLKKEAEEYGYDIEIENYEENFDNTSVSTILVNIVKKDLTNYNYKPELNKPKKEEKKPQIDIENNEGNLFLSLINKDISVDNDFDTQIDKLTEENINSIKYIYENYDTVIEKEGGNNKIYFEQKEKNNIEDIRGDSIVRNENKKEGFIIKQKLNKKGKEIMDIYKNNFTKFSNEILKREEKIEMPFSNLGEPGRAELCRGYDKIFFLLIGEIVNVNKLPLLNNEYYLFQQSKLFYYFAEYAFLKDMIEGVINKDSHFTVKEGTDMFLENFNNEDFLRELLLDIIWIGSMTDIRENYEHKKITNWEGEKHLFSISNLRVISKINEKIDFEFILNGINKLKEEGYITDEDVNYKLILSYLLKYNKGFKEYYDKIIKKIDTNRVKVLNTKEFNYLINKIHGKEVDKEYGINLSKYMQVTNKHLKNLLPYQIDGYKQALEGIQKYDGFIVSDDVGLGKTLVGGAVAGDYIETTTGKILIVAPKSVIEGGGWLNELKYLGFSDQVIKNRVILINNSSDKISKYKDRKDIDLCIVDEAHKLRNRKNGFGELRRLKYNSNCHFLLLSATPINNSILDLLNLVTLFYPEVEVSRNGELNIDRNKMKEDPYAWQLLTPFVSKYDRSKIVKTFGEITIKGSPIKEEYPSLNYVQIEESDEHKNNIRSFVNETFKYGINEESLSQLDISDSDLDNIELPENIGDIFEFTKVDDSKEEKEEIRKNVYNFLQETGILQDSYKYEDFDITNFLTKYTRLSKLNKESEYEKEKISKNFEVKGKIEGVDYNLSKEIKEFQQDFISNLWDFIRWFGTKGDFSYLLYHFNKKYNNPFMGKGQGDSQGLYGLFYYFYLKQKVSNLNNERIKQKLSDIDNKIKEIRHQFIYAFIYTSIGEKFFDDDLLYYYFSEVEPEDKADKSDKEKQKQEIKEKYEDNDVIDYNKLKSFFENVINNNKEYIITTLNSNPHSRDQWQDLIEYINKNDIDLDYFIKNNDKYFKVLINIARKGILKSNKNFIKYYPSYSDYDLNWMGATSMSDSHYKNIIKDIYGLKMNELKKEFNDLSKAIKNQKQEERSEGLFTGMLGTLILKRLDSSPYALYNTLYRMWEKGEIMPKEEDNDFKKSDKNNMALDKNDRKIIGGIVERFEPFLKKSSNNDNKLKKLIEIINNEKDKQWIVFTAYKETLTYIYNYIKDKFPTLNIETIDGSTPKQDKEDKIRRFSPKVNGYTLSNDDKKIDVLIATDTLAEGVNLHDVYRGINYDLPYNPVKLQQRVGRLFRVGAPNTPVFYNFVPSTFMEELTKVMEIIGDKEKVIQTFFGDKSVDPNNKEEVDKFINERIEMTKQDSIDYNKLMEDERKMDIFLGNGENKNTETIENNNTDSTGSGDGNNSIDTLLKKLSDKIGTEKVDTNKSSFYIYSLPKSNTGNILVIPIYRDQILKNLPCGFLKDKSEYKFYDINYYKDLYNNIISYLLNFKSFENIKYNLSNKETIDLVYYLMDFKDNILQKQEKLEVFEGTPKKTYSHNYNVINNSISIDDNKKDSNIKHLIVLY